MVDLVGGASTQSRARRPLPPGAVRAWTKWVIGTCERVAFEDANDAIQERDLLSWVGGQAGLLFGGPSIGLKEIPVAIREVMADHRGDVHGSYGHVAEHLLADELDQVFDGLLSDGAMGVRFFQNGGDACSAAARVARAATGRKYIISHGYHGTHLDYAHAPGNGGVPGIAMNLHKQFEWGDYETVANLAPDTAAIVVEVPAIDDDDSVRAFLSHCRSLCDKFGAAFVIDDVVLGFRIALGGTSEYYGVKPDMVCLGKAMSATGGVAALLGRRDLVGLLESDCFYSTTFGGAPGQCSVAGATVKWLRSNRVDVYSSEGVPGISHVGYLRQIGKELKDGLNLVFGERGISARCVGQPERSALVFDAGDKARREWCGHMIERGIMLDRPQFPTLVSTMQDVEKTLDAARSVHAA